MSLKSYNVTLDDCRSEAGAETGGNQHRRLGEASARDEFSGEATSQARDRDTPSSREFSGENNDTRWRRLNKILSSLNNLRFFTALYFFCI